MSKLKPLGSAQAPAASEEQVIEYLRLHRDFLDRHAELIAELVPPQHDGGRNVFDLQHYVIERLRRDLGETRRAHDAAVATARTNLGSQQRIHSAVIDLMNATSFVAFVEAITTDLMVKLDLDAVSLCVESATPNQPKTKSGVRFLAVGSIDGLLGKARPLLLRPAIAAERSLYGPAAALVKSDALLRIHIGADSPVGLLALGARAPGHFRPGQGTELLIFLARSIESTARAWLDLPG